MIKTKTELKEYLEEDRRALGRKTNKPGISDVIWKYEIALRKSEYYHNVSKGGVNWLLAKYYSYRVNSLGLKCGFTIARNSVGKGLSLAHVGTVIINSHAKVGDYCRIHAGVNIGTAAGTSDQTPIIGNNVYIGPGAKIFGKIVIADGVAIGANSVVNKSFQEPNVTIAGVPAKIVSRRGSKNHADCK